MKSSPCSPQLEKSPLAAPKTQCREGEGEGEGRGRGGGKDINLFPHWKEKSIPPSRGVDSGGPSTGEAREEGGYLVATSQQTVLKPDSNRSENRSLKISVGF